MKDFEKQLQETKKYLEAQLQELKLSYKSRLTDAVSMACSEIQARVEESNKLALDMFNKEKELIEKSKDILPESTFTTQIEVAEKRLASILELNKSMLDKFISDQKSLLDCWSA
ncbi:hypothetical protein CVU83_03470 [Candidatus Falkowbacteria bacterium HGW-Falkowbacteria-2]|uniref:Uncharacterized protein n=1 Tax=Candidatus Falkowbacteria bacterium HGW-Falkowbacteria-2 TaxID=2013769 RepID=A0A2N2DX43_9BACT|nr:MAG: hypothetical protein CVU83_03470 [Candidatus Falkowbacteria bacterium HGW-Falkowbacteria-2]